MDSSSIFDITAALQKSKCKTVNCHSPNMVEKDAFFTLLGCRATYQQCHNDIMPPGVLKLFILCSEKSILYVHT
jgi:hypothetical protein